MFLEDKKHQCFYDSHEGHKRKCLFFAFQVKCSRELNLMALALKCGGIKNIYSYLSLIVMSDSFLTFFFTNKRIGPISLILLGI